MAEALRVLIVDDSADDATLVLRVLRAGGFEPSHRRVDTPEAMAEALDLQAWDIVISDWKMPHFSAGAAFAAMSARNLDLPFIIVSGTIEEEAAIEALRAGAHDFMSKDRLARLATAVQRELREASLRRDRRNMQEQLFLADRIASVGLLAAGVAHEISNPLTSLVANLELTLSELETLPESEERRGRAREQVGDAMEAAGRIRQLVQDLKLYARGEENARAPVDVRHALDFALRMAAHEVRRCARVVKEYGQVPLVNANEGRLGQVFLNLIVNAAQAIDRDAARVNEIRVMTSTTSHGDVLVEVRDTGCGMPKELLSRLFTPFLTTKPIGVGTGLGLSICNRIVTELGGTIAVDSNVGQGTTFRITLPRIADA
jgi:signal transduction histidine kinase